MCQGNCRTTFPGETIKRLVDDAGFVLQSLQMAQNKGKLRLSSAERKAMKKIMAKVRAAKRRKKRE